jgi:hypothetical protein
MTQSGACVAGTQYFAAEKVPKIHRILELHWINSILQPLPPSPLHIRAPQHLHLFKEVLKSCQIGRLTLTSHLLALLSMALFCTTLNPYLNLSKARFSPALILPETLKDLH